MIYGIGCDLSQIARWEDETLRLRLTDRFFAPEERAYIASRGRVAAASAAGIFAAKEALSKALRCGIGPARPEEIVVLHTASGAPYLELRGETLALSRRLGVGRFHLSISHDGGVAMALCVAETVGPEKEEPCPKSS